MRKFVLAAAMVTAISSAAFGADDVAAPDPSRFDWGGWYVGGQLGVGQGHLDWLEGPDASTSFASGAPGAFILSQSPSGGIYGAVLGYNWQSGNFVYGIEGSWAKTDIERSTAQLTPDETTEARSIWKIGPRIGFAQSNWLLYLTGGYASADVRLTSTNFINLFYESSEHHNGHFIGGGIDWALPSNWVLGLDLSHIKLDDEVHNDPDIPGFGPLDVEAADFVINTLTVRLTYKF